MHLSRTQIRALPWVLAAAACGCNAIFGIQGGQATSGGAGATTTTTSVGTGGAGTTTTTTTTTSIGTGGSGTTTTTTTTTSIGTGGGAPCQPDRAPPCDADGGVCTPKVLEGNQPSAYRLVVSGDFVFYTTGDAATIRRLRYDGTGSIGYTSPTNAGQIATDGAKVYWTDYYCCPGYVQQMPIDGGAVTPLAVLTQQIGGNAIATYGGTVYWTTYSPPVVMSISAGSTQQMATVIAGADAGPMVASPGHVSINDGDYLYWGDDTGVMRLKVADIGKPTAQTETFAATSAYVVATALDTDAVYWISNAGDLSSKPKGAPAAQLPHVYYQASQPSGSDVPVAVATDGAYVYWLAQGGAVNKVAKAGGPVVPVSASPPGMGSPTDIAVDCGAVYWTVDASSTQSKGMVYRAAKGP